MSIKPSLIFAKLNARQYIFFATGVSFCVLLIRSRKKSGSVLDAYKREPKRTWAFLIIAGLYIAALPFFGFSMATVLCAALLGFSLNGFRVNMRDAMGIAVMSLVLGLGVNILFGVVFEITLP